MLPLLLLALAFSARAGDPNTCQWGNFEMPLPGMTGTICDFVNSAGGNAVIAFVDLIVGYITMAIVAAAVIAIVIAGYIYMTAGGNASRVGTAKSIITAALIGIVLALAAFLILDTIHPQFASEVKGPGEPGGSFDEDSGSGGSF